jgi:MOSC domain-containing protein YiiM
MTQLLITGLQIGMPRTLGQAGAAAAMDREWTTGFFKEPVTGSLLVTRLGIDGDGQADLVNHGGLDKAINVYPYEHYAGWMKELDIVLEKGAFGENFTTTGLLEQEVCIGDVFQAEGLLLQVTQPRQPCWKLARRWRINDLAARVERTGRTGWYFRVLQEASVSPDQQLTLVERQHPEWSVARANEVMHHRMSDTGAARALSQCTALSLSWQGMLGRSGRGGLGGGQ